MRSWMNGRMGFIVVLAFPWCVEPALFKGPSKSAPVWINALFLDEGHKVELGVELICFGAWIGNKSLLVKFFCNL